MTMSDDTPTDEGTTATTETDEGTDQNGDFDARVNKAISSQLSRFAKSLEKQRGEQFGELLSPVMQQLAELREAPRPKGDSGEPADGEGDKTAMRLEAQQRKHEAIIKKLQEERDAEKAQREAEHATRLRNEERSALTTALHDAGVTGTTAKAAMALLYTEEQRIKRDENDKIAFEFQQEWGEELVPLEEGVKRWLNTDDGKSFLPPRGAAGAGSGPAKVGRRGNTPQSPLQAAKALLGQKGIG